MKNCPVAISRGRKLSAFALLALVMFFDFPLASGDDYSLLTSDDYRLMDTSEPEIVRDDGLRTYLEWRCFQVEDVTIGCAKICHERIDGTGYCDSDDDPDSGYPSLSVHTSNVDYDFDYEHEDGDCAKHAEELSKLLSGQKNVCILAAYLQDIDSSRTLWVLNRVKTEAGEWTGDEDP